MSLLNKIKIILKKIKNIFIREKKIKIYESDDSLSLFEDDVKIVYLEQGIDSNS